MALRIVSGLSVREIARAFVVSDAAMEPRITRAKARIGAGDAPFEAPGPVERAERFDAHFYHHGARGAFLMRAGRVAEARQAFDRAIALAGTAAQAANIRQYLDGLAARG